MQQSADNLSLHAVAEKLVVVMVQYMDEHPAYVVLLDASGTVKWHGHGAAKDLEPLVRAALH